MLVCCIKQKTLSSSVIVVGGGRGDEDEDDKREGREGERQCTLVCISARLHPRQFTKPGRLLTWSPFLQTLERIPVKSSVLFDVIVPLTARLVNEVEHDGCRGFDMKEMERHGARV